MPIELESRIRLASSIRTSWTYSSHVKRPGVYTNDDLQRLRPN